MPTTTALAGRHRARGGRAIAARSHVPVVLSFDVEEHFHIESAAGLSIDEPLQQHYRRRVDVATRWLLQDLAASKVRATFFVLGEVARHNPGLVRDIAAAGHEIASHGWDHRRLHRLTPAEFRSAVRSSKQILEDITGTEVSGFRAPTFSLVPTTAWAIDVLIEAGFVYDSSIYPVRHDRYGVPAAPRTPFLARGYAHCILELPPLSYRLVGINVPVGGGGYFRLLPTWLLHRGIRQMRRMSRPGVVMLYFHPWEFDPEQRRLPLRGLNRLRTYAGIHATRRRLSDLMQTESFVRARDALQTLRDCGASLECFGLAKGGKETLPRGRGQFLGNFTTEEPEEIRQDQEESLS